MFCPRCRIRSTRGVCLNCGWAPAPRQRTISFQSESVHSSRGRVARDAPAGHGAGSGSARRQPSGVQRARTGQGENRRAIRRTGKSRTGTAARIPRQQKLSLETLPPAPPAVEKPQPAVNVTSLPREILLSRILASILDLSLAGLIGFSFCFLASWVSGLDFFALESFRLGVVCTAGFYVFNSFFFLLGAGQTPGMYCTRLGLVGEKQQESIPAWAVALWILLYPLVTVTLVGLLWGLLDPWRRCIHDRVSGTRVVSLVESVSTPSPE